MSRQRHRNELSSQPVSVNTRQGFRIAGTLAEFLVGLWQPTEEPASKDRVAIVRSQIEVNSRALVGLLLANAALYEELQGLEIAGEQNGVNEQYN